MSFKLIYLVEKIHQSCRENALSLFSGELYLVIHDDGLE